MKNLVLYLMMFLLPAGLLAQDNSDTNVSSKELTGFASVSDAAKVARQIVKVSGLKANFAIAEADVPNAVAVLQRGKRYILYNPRFMTALTKLTGTKWAPISVLAHEIGHHLYGKPGPNGMPAMATELEADEFSGFALMKMGATLEEAQAAMSLIATKQASRSHPGRDDRNRSIARGFKNAGGFVPDEAITVRSKTEVRTEQPVTISSAVAATIEFNANPDKEYYVTTNMTVVRIDDQSIKAIAKVSRSTSSSYPYIIYDDTGYRLYVKNSGSIVDRKGNVVGNMKAVAR